MARVELHYVIFDKEETLQRKSWGEAGFSFLSMTEEQCNLAVDLLTETLVRLKSHPAFTGEKNVNTQTGVSGEDSPREGRQYEASEKELDREGQRGASEGTKRNSLGWL